LARLASLTDSILLDFRSAREAEDGFLTEEASEEMSVDSRLPEFFFLEIKISVSLAVSMLGHEDKREKE